MISGIGAAAEAFATKHNKPANEKEISYHVCKVCPTTFNRRYNRDRHMELVHKVPRPILPPLFPEKPVPKNPAKNPEDGIIYTMPDPPINVLTYDKTTGNKRVNSDTSPPPLRRTKKAKRVLNMDEDFGKRLVIDEGPPSPELPDQKDLDTEDPKAEELEDKSCQTEENINMIQMPLSKEVAITILVTSK